MRIRHTNTAAELDVPDEAVQYFPDYEPVDDDQAGDVDEPTVTFPDYGHGHEDLDEDLDLS